MKIAALCTAMVLAAGCHSLRVPQGIRPDASGWVMDGRTPARTGVSAGWVVPPLVPAWEADLGSSMGEGSPVIADSIVLVGTLRGEILVFQAQTGRKLGGMSFGDAIPGTPVLQGDTAYIPLSNAGESLVAYDLARGAVVWKATCGEITTSPLLLKGKLYAGTAEGVLYCLDAESGVTRWRFEIPGNTRLKGIRSSPASDGTIVVFGADDGCLYAVDAELGTLRWRADAGGPVMAAPVLADRRAFAGTVTGDFIAVSLDSGTILWRRNIGAPIYAGAAAADRLVVFGTTARMVHALRQDDGGVAWERQVGGVVSAAGAIAGSWFFVGTLGRSIAALRLEDGTLAWRDSVEGRIKSALAAAHGRLLVATDDRTLRAYRSGTP